MKTPLEEREEIRARLWGSLLLFTETFYPLLTGNKFIMPNPPGREPHPLTICRELVKCFRLETKHLLINIAPGHGKSTLLCFFAAWAMSRYPDSRFLYISYSKKLATKHTATIKRLMCLAPYRDLFDVRISSESKAKDLFHTTAGGCIGSFGSYSDVVGQDAGLPALDRFSGAILLDDLIKPDDAHSDTIRENVITNYRETIQQRARGINVPTICIGQRLHEMDLPAYLLSGADGYKWTTCILKSLDDAGNPLYPEAFPLDFLLNKKEHDIYVFASQHQQNPQPSGGALFKREFFPLLDEEPNYITTFITADTAETTNIRNDATAFGFFGLYEIETMGRKTGVLSIHCINAIEIRVEPKDLKDEFLSFYQQALLHKSPPQHAYIEKKSTGVTLISILEELRGLRIINVERHKSKTQRFYDAQPFIAAKQLSFSRGAHHVEMCLSHMSKITGNDSHAFDDLADCICDSIRIGLIEKIIYRTSPLAEKNTQTTKDMAKSFNQQLNSKRKSYNDAGTFR